MYLIIDWQERDYTFVETLAEVRKSLDAQPLQREVIRLEIDIACLGGNEEIKSFIPEEEYPKLPFSP